MTAEATLRAAVLKRINEDYPRRTSGVLVFGRPAGAATGPGHPDLFGVCLGRFIALEIKVLKSSPTPLQIQRIKDLRQAGACAWVIRTPLEASKAIYQCKQGVAVMPDEPIDFDDWFKEITSTPVNIPVASTASVADKAEPSTEADSAALEEILDLGEQAAAQPPEPADKPKRRRGKVVPPEPTPEPAPLEELPNFDLPTEASMPEIVSAIQAQADADQQAYLDANEPAIVVGVMDPASSQAILVELIKAVGDRVTLVFEEVNKTHAVLLSINDAIVALKNDFDALIEDEG